MKKEYPKFSFCMTTYKRPSLLRSTLQTILAQTITDFEIIVSDNDPERSAEPVIQQIGDSRIKYFANPENLGMIRSFNRSIENSSGAFIAMITDDDPVYPDMLETLSGLIDQYPDHGFYLAGCNWFCTDPDLADFYNCKVGVNSCLAKRPIDEIQAYDSVSFLKNFFNFNIFPNYLWSTAVVKRDILMKMGGVPDYDTPFLGDYAYIGVAGGDSGCVTINKALGHQTLHKQNFGRAQNEQLVILGPRFMDYVSSKLSHLQDWKMIKKDMEHFVAVWIVRHVAFLKAYSIHKGDKENLTELKSCEKRIFALPFMRPYRAKYFLLTQFPALHDSIVKWKRKAKRK